MSKVPELRRLLREDFQDAPEWIDRLIIPLNLFMEQTFGSLNRNLTIDDNSVGQWSEVTLTTPADYVTGGFTNITIPWKFPTPVKGVFVGYLSKVSDTYQKQLVAPTVSWYQPNNSQIIINYITGLSVNTKYNCRLLIL